MRRAFLPYIDSIKMGKYQSRAASGFTLVEVLVSLAIMSILFGTVYRSFDIYTRSYTKENVKAGVQQRTRMGIDLLARDIRLAGLDPLGTAGARIIAADTANIQFSADLNYDGDVNDPFENITYAQNGDLLRQTSDLGTGFVTDTLLDNVDALAFTYLDATDTPLAAPVGNPQNIRTVIVSLTMQRPAGRDGSISRTYTTRVRCRNL
ncbi:MAG: prepilin-type N-terminal cleavage/methylation domain-containing protein [Desulfobacterales bacterium]